MKTLILTFISVLTLNASAMTCEVALSMNKFRHLKLETVEAVVGVPTQALGIEFTINSTIEISGLDMNDCQNISSDQGMATACYGTAAAPYDFVTVACR